MFCCAYRVVCIGLYLKSAWATACNSFIQVSWSLWQLKLPHDHGNRLACWILFLTFQAVHSVSNCDNLTLIVCRPSGWTVNTQLHKILLFNLRMLKSVQMPVLCNRDQMQTLQYLKIFTPCIMILLQMPLQPGVGLGLLYNMPPGLSAPCSISPFVYTHLSQVHGHVIQPSHSWSSSSSCCIQLSVQHLFFGISVSCILSIWPSHLILWHLINLTMFCPLIMASNSSFCALW